MFNTLDNHYQKPKDYGYNLKKSIPSFDTLFTNNQSSNSTLNTNNTKLIPTFSKSLSLLRKNLLLTNNNTSIDNTKIFNIFLSSKDIHSSTLKLKKNSICTINGRYSITGMESFYLNETLLDNFKIKTIKSILILCSF
jgi:hypothetical protein